MKINVYLVSCTKIDANAANDVRKKWLADHGYNF